MTPPDAAPDGTLGLPKATSLGCAAECTARPGLDLINANYRPTI